VKRAFGAVLVAIALGAVAAAVLFPYLDHFFPFDLHRPPDFLTRTHLQLLAREPERCYAALDRANVAYRRAPPLERDDGCGYQDAVQLEQSQVSYGGRVLLRCPAMLALLLWERHTLVPAAQRHFDRPAASVRHLGTYSCRDIREGGSGSRSQHASANAIDVAGITVAGHGAITLRADWGRDDARGRFLREVRDGACRVFGVVLSPDRDRAHADHLHFDMSGLRVCH
jgi:hypothetical protein